MTCVDEKHGQVMKTFIKKSFMTLLRSEILQPFILLKKEVMYVDSLTHSFNSFINWGTADMAT
ncbi:MAG: hypothetical protein NPIRA01_02350 [Nitrospirales bacterium]|nr:MAG: hypothetical protein NPIRA01_02350 [Nitrospirales bacterium]